MCGACGCEKAGEGAGAFCEEERMDVQCEWKACMSTLADAPIRSANHSSLTSSGSQMSLGKLVVRSSTSTNSTSLV